MACGPLRTACRLPQERRSGRTSRFRKAGLPERTHTIDMETYNPRRPLRRGDRRHADVHRRDRKMFASMAAIALALQLGVPAQPLNESIPSAQNPGPGNPDRGNPATAVAAIRRRAATATISMSGTASATRTGWCRRSFNRAGIIPWSTAAAGGRCHAVTARTSIFATGSAIRRARCHGRIRTGRPGYHTRRNGYYEMR